MSRYILQEEIGRGAWGVVYKALDTFTGETVAVKVLREDAGAPRRELMLARKVTHRNVCRVYEYFDNELGQCIVMEFVDGGSLADLLRRSGPLPLEEALPIALQILDGIEAAHVENVIHRDLKPANILLTRDRTVKITDFGLAKVIDSTISSIGEAPGTPRYMAPEQARGRKCDARADIYSFGVMLEEMLEPGFLPAHIKVAIQKCTELVGRRIRSVAEVRKALTDPPAARRVPAMTGFLVAALIVASVGSYMLWSRTWNYAKAAQTAAAPPVVVKAAPPVKTLPTVGVSVKGSLGVALADGLRNTGKFRVLDRSNIDTTVSEHDLGKKTPLDETTEQRAGKMLGAQYLMYASTQQVNNAIFQIDAWLVSTETGEYVFSASIQGRPEESSRLARELAQRFHL